MVFGAVAMHRGVPILGDSQLGQRELDAYLVIGKVHDPDVRGHSTIQPANRTHVPGICNPKIADQPGTAG